MPVLVLFRHAKTEANSASGADFDRVLTPRGPLDAQAVAAALIAGGYGPDRVLLSPAARAQQTWDAVADQLPGRAPRLIDDLYLAPADVLARHGGVAQPMPGVTWVIAHNPGLHALAVTLAAGAVDLPTFPTSAAAVFRHDDHWRFEQLYLAKRLRGVA